MKGRVENYKLIYDNPEEIGLILESLEGKRVDIIIKRETKHRSNNQNRYYWGVIIPNYQLGFQKHCIELLSSDLSREVTDFILSNMYVIPEQAHEALKNEYAQEIYNETNIKKQVSSSQMSSLEFENYTEYCRKFIGEKFGIDVELPNE